MLVLVSKFPNLAILVGKKMENICGTSTKKCKQKNNCQNFERKNVTHNELKSKINFNDINLKHINNSRIKFI
jgi:hypothetical protein